MPTSIVFAISGAATIAGIIVIVVGLELRYDSKSTPKHHARGIRLLATGIVVFLAGVIFGFSMLGGN